SSDLVPRRGAAADGGGRGAARGARGGDLPADGELQDPGRDEQPDRQNKVRPILPTVSSRWLWRWVDLLSCHITAPNEELRLAGDHRRLWSLGWVVGRCQRPYP